MKIDILSLTTSFRNLFDGETRFLVKHLHHISLSHLFNSMVHHGMAKAIVKRYSYGCFMQKRKQEVFPTLSSCARWIMLAYCVWWSIFQVYSSEKRPTNFICWKGGKIYGFCAERRTKKTGKVFFISGWQEINDNIRLITEDLSVGTRRDGNGNQTTENFKFIFLKSVEINLLGVLWGGLHVLRETSRRNI